MPRITPPLAVSPPERLILETVAASEQLPASVRKRARVVLLAGDGADNCTIGLDVGMHRSRVHFWRRRFSASGIRGLWDAEGALPRERIPEAVEQAIVFDCLYRPSERRSLPGNDVGSQYQLERQKFGAAAGSNGPEVFGGQGIAARTGLA